KVKKCQKAQKEPENGAAHRAAPPPAHLASSGNSPWQITGKISWRVTTDREAKLFDSLKAMKLTS
ncbi:MAG: hypothetical protein K8F91_06180, partial [Candidatus Obscuribacterales bacterium]|nr:hypothetical protein [Candidatus Obscuribacterales bacterium]